MKDLCLLLFFLSAAARAFSLPNRPISHIRSLSSLANVKTGNKQFNIRGGGDDDTAANEFRAATLLTSTISSDSDGSASKYNDNNNEGTKNGKYRQKLMNLFNNIKTAPFVMSIAALLIGYKLGAKSVTAAPSSLSAGAAATTTGAAAAASTAASSSTRSLARQYPIITGILLVVALRDGWSLIPAWARKNILRLVGRRGRAVEEESDPDDLTSFTAISMKLRTLFQQGKDKLSSSSSGADEIERPGLVFLALARLITQLKPELAGRRDESYETSGTDVKNPKDVLEGIDEYFEFADWAYNEFEEGVTLKDSLASKGYSLLRHETAALPGHVAHYVAVSTERKEALIGIKGTSNFEDMLTDCCGTITKHEFKDGPFVEGGQREISCHEGILLSSKRLADDLMTFVESVLLPAGYRIRVVGHSLGAGAAVIFAMILRSKIEKLRKDKGDKLSVLAFASPAILDYESARSCESFVTTFINNSDVIPRCSLANLVHLFETMKVVNDRLDDLKLSPRGARSTAKFLKMLANSGKHGDDIILSADEIREAVDSSQDKIDILDPDHLYVGGRVIHMYDQWTKEGYGNKSDYEDVGDDFDESTKVPTAEKIYVSDGTAKALRMIEIDDRMLSDHMSPGYRASIRSLLLKSA